MLPPETESSNCAMAARKRRVASARDPRRFSPFLFCAISRGARHDARRTHRGAAALQSSRGKYPVGMTPRAPGPGPAEGGQDRAPRRSRPNARTSSIEAARGDDFVGVQTYTRQSLRRRPHAAARSRCRDARDALRILSRSARSEHSPGCAIAKVPIIVTENGIGTRQGRSAASSTCAAHSTASRDASATASTFAATTTGRCSTTSNGTRLPPDIRHSRGGSQHSSANAKTQRRMAG